MVLDVGSWLGHALAVNWQNLALGHEVFTRDGATFVRNRDYPHIHDANFVFDATADSPESIEALRRCIEREYEHAPQRVVAVGPATSPALVADLALRGDERREALIMSLDGDLAGSPQAHQTEALETDDHWTSYRELKRRDWAEHAARYGQDPDDHAVPDGLAACARLKCPPVRYFLAWIDGAPRGFCSAWAGFDGVGQIEDLFVEAEHRHRGIGTALVHRCVAEARGRGAGTVVLACDASDTPKHMYAQMGFAPIGTCGVWITHQKRSETPASTGS